MKLRNRQISYVKSANKHIAKSNFFLESFKTREYLKLKAESVELNLNSKLTSIKGDTIFLNSLIGKNDKLFFKFSENSCTPCVEMELSFLEQNANEIGINNIIIIASYKNLRHLKLLKQKVKQDIAIYSINESIGFPGEFDNIPFLFVINSSKQLKFIFIPEKSLPNLSEQYYNILKASVNSK